MNILNIVTLLTPKVIIGDHPTRQKNVYYLKIKNFKVNPQRNRNISVPTVCDPLNVFSQLSHQKFVHVSIVRIKVTTRKGITEGLPTNLPDLEETCTICLLKKATKIPRGKTIYVLKYPPGFMLQMDFHFSILKASVDLPRILWLYVLLLHTPLDFHI